MAQYAVSAIALTLSLQSSKKNLHDNSVPIFVTFVYHYTAYTKKIH